MERSPDESQQIHHCWCGWRCGVETKHITVRIQLSAVTSQIEVQNAEQFYQLKQECIPAIPCHTLPYLTIPFLLHSLQIMKYISENLQGPGIHCFRAATDETCATVFVNTSCPYNIAAPQTIR